MSPPARRSSRAKDQGPRSKPPESDNNHHPSLINYIISHIIICNREIDMSQAVKLEEYGIISYDGGVVIYDFHNYKIM